MKKPRQKGLNFVLNYGIYDFDVMYSLGEEDDQLKRNLRKAAPNISDEAIEDILTARSRGRTTMLTSGATVIRLRYVPKTPEDFGVLAHETFHAVEFLMARINMPLVSSVSGEAYAYAIGFLTEQLFKHLKKVC